MVISKSRTEAPDAPGNTTTSFPSPQLCAKAKTTIKELDKSSSQMCRLL